MRHGLKFFAEMCYSCGDVETDTYVSQSRCMIPNAGANATDGQATLIPCTNGICYVSIIFHITPNTFVYHLSPLTGA
jgi:hypothetical protein